MTTVIPISDRYRSAIRFALVLQVPVALLFASLLDNGHLAKIGGYAMIGFWIGVAVIVSRRPRTPSPFDLAFIRYGYLPLVLVAAACAAIVHGCHS